MFHSNLNWDRIPTKIKRAMEASLEHLDEHKFVLNDTNIEVIDDYCWDLITCHLKQLLHMNLAHNKLIKLSSHISSLTHLQTLNLTNNHLEELPNSIVSLSQLRILKLGHNRLTALPSSFGSLKSLEILDLTGNELTEDCLGNDFFQLSHLRALYLGDNLFETFPNEHIDKLQNLQILVLRHNRLRHLPKEVTRLPQLKELHIQQNRIQVIPPAIGKLDLTNAKHIYRFEPNPFLPELALHMSHLTRLASYLTSESYREVYQSYFLNFDDQEVNDLSKKSNKKTKHLPSKSEVLHANLTPPTMAAASTSSETVRVIVRCRPMNQRENDLKSQPIIVMNTQIHQVMLENIEQTNEPPKQFTFDAVYPEDSITETIYADSVFPLVESVLEGYNATVFAYGQTGCGKSYTMQGVNTPGSPQRGVIPRSFEHIFEASSVAAGTKYLIRASYLEIYNESIRDLLGKDVKATLDLKEFVDKGVQVPSLTWHQCSSVLDCERLMDKGNRSRATGATLMNKDSSRSHSIFTIVTEMCTRSELDGKDHIRAGKLNLVDLAGSERQSKTHAEGDRLREATRINLSLSALGNVISALVDGRSKHIPYRDSKLTRLLQDSLGGNTKTLMVAAISPANDNYDETLSTLRYANRAKNIKNKPRINEDPRDAQMKLLQEEINRLKQELLSNGNPSRDGNQLSSGKGAVDYNDEEIEKEKERLREEFAREASELRRQCETERLTKEELQRKYDDLKGQYDQEIDALGSTNAGGDTQGGTTTRGKNNNKKKNGVNKRKSDRPSPNIDESEDGTSKPIDQMDSQEKLQRLLELEKKFVGGEEVNNEERKKKRKKKLNEMQEKQEQRKRFNRAVDVNDEDMMMRVFDNAQEELHFTAKQLERERVENKRLKTDTEDLQFEFERDRQGYLNTIRAQEKQLLLYRTMLEKMSGLMQRNCNYSNIERIIEQARYDEEKSEYTIPDPFNEEVQFPQVGNLPVNNGRTTQNNFQPSPRASAAPPTDYDTEYSMPIQSTSNGYHNPISTMSSDELERRYGSHSGTLTTPIGQTRNKRQEQLLSESTAMQGSKLRPLKMNNSENDYMNRRLNPFEASNRVTRKYGLPSDKP